VRSGDGRLRSIVRAERLFDQSGKVEPAVAHNSTASPIHALVALTWAIANVSRPCVTSDTLV
jgi:hypothetical protein